MAYKHIYFIIQNLNLTPTRWARLVGTPPIDDQPGEPGLLDQTPVSSSIGEKGLQKRFNIIGNAVLYEGDFDSDIIKLSSLRNLLRRAANVADGRLSPQLSIPVFKTRTSLTVEFSLDAVPSLRLLLFGVEADNDNTSWEQSHAEITAYMAEHSKEWNPEL